MLLPWQCLILALFAASLAACGGCDRNISGRLAAVETGTLLDPPPSRESPVAALDEACGTGDAEAATGTFSRAPYLQNVSAEAATVVWTLDDDEPVRVVLSQPDGTAVATHHSELEPTRHLRDAHQHFVRFEGLEPGTVYCYAILAGETELLGRTGFRTAPAPGSGEPVRFIAFGDSGWDGGDQEALRQQMDTLPFDLAIVAGDVVYEDGTLNQYERRHFAVYDPLFRSVPHYPVLGNHDYKTANGGPFLEVFHLPPNAPEGAQERWFSFDWGDVHFVALDTEAYGEAQAAWLRADLAANELPWVVVYAHRPPYSSGKHGSSSGFRRWFSPILEEHDVALVIAGHDHHYERVQPVGATRHFVTGGGGRGVRPPSPKSFTEHAEAVIHLLYVEVTEAQVRVHAVDGTGQVFDGAVIAP
jgi:acid phosphatase type 7